MVVGMMMVLEQADRESVAMSMALTHCERLGSGAGYVVGLLLLLAGLRMDIVHLKRVTDVWSW